MDSIDDNTILEEPYTQATSSGNWHKVIWKTVAVYELSEWQDFAGDLVTRGLYSFQDYTYQDQHAYLLAFLPQTPTSIKNGPGQILLTPEFARHMRLSPRHTVASGSNGFVILLHDPHWNVSGTFDTLAGLRALVSSNQSLSFEFLVEGEYRGMRKIGLATLDRVLDATSNETSRTRMVQSLLGNYLIDTPMAYRLLYGPRISATAIDDNRFLQYDAPRVLRTRLEQFSSLEKLFVAVKNLNLPDDAAKTSLVSAINMARLFLEADISDATDDQAVEYYDTLAKTLKALAEAAEILIQRGIKFDAQTDAQALGRDALAYEDEARIYKFAVKRNATMADQIAAASQQPHHSIPIAFIGNFHTAGITSILRTKGIGYAVIEPRPRLPVTRSEIENFSRAVHRNTSARYLASVRLRKLKVAPTVTEVRTIYRPKMVAKGARLRLELKPAQDQVAAISGATLDINEFLSATGDNGNLASLKLSFNDGSQPPLPPDLREPLPISILVVMGRQATGCPL